MSANKNFNILPCLLVLLTFLFWSATVSAQSPVGWWKFDDGSGTIAVDSSGNGYTATLHNGVSWVAGRYGDAVSANPSSYQYASIPAINLSGTRATTVALWAKRTYSTVGGHVLFEATTNYNNSATGFAFFPDDSSCVGIQASLHGNVGYVANCYSQPSSGVWHHIAVVYDKTQSGGNQVKFYLDGVLQPVNRSLFANTNTNAFGNNPIFVYSRGGSSEYNSGLVDDLRIYSTALTAAQIQQLYNGGNSLGTLTAVPSSLNFGNVNLNSYLAKQVTLINTGFGALTVSNVTIAGAEFSLSPISTPFTLQPQGSTQLTVTFSPTVLGLATGTVTLTSNASDPTLVISLSGTGVTAPPPHSVSLSWTASASGGVIGYNMYRSTNSSGPYTKINSSLISTTSYTDQTVQGSTTYYYVSTAVNSQQQESGYSNQAVANVP